MLRILDRYLLREVLTPFLLALLLLTFALMIPPIIDQGEALIAKGASWGIVARVMLTLVPQALGVTIPMALLVGILVALGRMAGDRETVALEACGVSLARLLRPLLLFAVLATAATTYVMIVALPAANQAFRDIAFKLVMSFGDSEIRSRVFFEKFPRLVVFTGDVKPGGDWRDVLVADSDNPEAPQLHLAASGRLLIDQDKRLVQLVLEDGATHNVKLREPDEYKIGAWKQTALTIDPNAIFPREGPLKGLNEKTIAELKADLADTVKKGQSPHNQIMKWQQKFSIPASCFSFMLIALGLGVSNRRDGRLASFVQAIGVVFIYWLLLEVSDSVAKAGTLGPWFPWVAMWIPDMVVALWGAALIWRKLRAPERPFQLALPFLTRRHPVASAPDLAKDSPQPAKGDRVVVVIRIPHFPLPRLSILDWYVLRQALRIFTLAVAALLMLFYIGTFIDLSDHLFKGRTGASTIVSYLGFETPQFIYYSVPLAVLMGALVTIGALTKNTELVVMKACGISLYRAAAPLLILAAIGSATLMVLEERILAYSNRKAETINDAIRGRLPRTSGVNRRWIAANNGNIYQYVYFDSARNQLNGLSIYEFAKNDRSTLSRRSYFSRVTFSGDREAKGQVTWQGERGWQRDFTPPSRFTSFSSRSVVMEGPGYFGSEGPDAEQMSYSQLRDHVAALEVSGFDVVPYVVALHRKLAFPFVTLIMTLIGVPFAVTTGKRGAMYGIGAGMVLAILYWTAISVFGAIGASGLMAPALAAWAPNIIFGCAALYLLLTVRT